MRTIVITAAVVVAASVAGSTSTQAEPALSAFVHSRVGQASAPFFLDAVPTVESEITQAVSFVVGGEASVGRGISIGFELPAAPSLVAQPAGSYVDNKAFGNPQLLVSRAFSPIARRGVIFRPRVRAKLGLPLAGHGPASTLTRNRVVAISAAVDGWRNQELYVPGVVPLTVAANLDVEHRRWRGEASAKLPLLVRIHDADAGMANTRPIALAPTVTLRGGIVAGGGVELSVATHIAALVPAPIEQPGGSVQVSVEPRVAWSLGGPGPGVALTLDALIALGGPLSGTAGVGFGVAVWR